VVVWDQGADGKIAHDEMAQEAMARALRKAIDDVAPRLLDRWKYEDEEVRRALLWFLSAVPQLQDRYADLVEEELPEKFERAWSLIKASPQSQGDFDEVTALEDWVHSGR
jgi:hypothetical protein